MSDVLEENEGIALASAEGETTISELDPNPSVEDTDLLATEKSDGSNAKTTVAQLKEVTDSQIETALSGYYNKNSVNELINGALAECLKKDKIYMKTGTFTTNSSYFIVSHNLNNMDCLIFLTSSYMGSAGRADLVFTTQINSPNSFVVYVRSGNGSLVPDGTKVKLDYLVISLD